MSTEALEQFYRDAEDKGAEVYVTWHPKYHIIDTVEIDGVELHNENYDEEVNDAYWVDDANRVAVRSMY